MSYIGYRQRLDQLMSSQGDGTGVTDMGVDGVAITGATTAVPTVLTIAGHSLVDGDWIWIDGMTSITEPNGLREVADDETNTFTVLDENGDKQGTTGTFGGTVDMNIALVYKPTSLQVAHITRIHLTAADVTSVIDGLLGVTRLSSVGIVLAVFNGDGLVKKLATVFGWSDWSLYGSDTVPIPPFDASVEDIYEAHANLDTTINVAGLDVMDLRIDGVAGEFLALYTDEDLAGLDSLRASVTGYLE